MSLQRVGDQQLAERHHDWIVMIVVSKDHPNPSTVASIHVFISSLHNGPVNAGHQPCSHHNAAQQPQYAVAYPHHHVVEKEEVVEAVERLPVVESQRFVFISRRYFVLKEEDLNQNYLEDHQGDNQTDGQNYNSQVGEHVQYLSVLYRKNQQIDKQQSKQEVDKMDNEVAPQCKRYLPTRVSCNGSDTDSGARVVKLLREKTLLPFPQSLQVFSVTCQDMEGVGYRVETCKDGRS